MLDENLPTFYLGASKDSVRHDATLYLSQFGSEASPAYTLRHPDPASPDSKNRYAAALCDSYNPAILYGEVLLIPEWTQPTFSQEDVRKNGGVPPPPQPLQPTEFTIQLYNPDQQIVVRNKPSTWKESQYWEFDMPQQTFRQPSASTLDRTQNDPSILESTPTIDLKWKKEGKLSKDLMCYLSGKSKNPDGSKKKHKEPDIPLAFFRNMRELTVYEPNLQRIDVEDSKGFEVVLLLSAIVIKDVFFGQMREVFNINEASRQQQRTAGPRRSSAGASPPPQAPTLTARYHRPTQSPTLNDSSQRPALTVQTPGSRPPPTDPRSQWEIDAETARLRKQADQEAKERMRREKEDARQAQQIAKEEEIAARRRQADVDRETERLRQEYYAEQRRLERSGRHPQLPPRHSAPLVPGQQQYRPPQAAPQGPYLQTPGPTGPYMSGAAVPGSSSSTFLGPQSQAVKPKRSGLFGLRTRGEHDHKLAKKQSAIF